MNCDKLNQKIGIVSMWPFLTSLYSPEKWKENLVLWAAFITIYDAWGLYLENVIIVFGILDLSFLTA